MFHFSKRKIFCYLGVRFTDISQHGEHFITSVCFHKCKVRASAISSSCNWKLINVLCLLGYCAETMTATQRFYDTRSNQIPPQHPRVDTMCAQTTTVADERASRKAGLEYYQAQLTIQAEKTDEQLRELLQRVEGPSSRFCSHRAETEQSKNTQKGEADPAPPRMTSMRSQSSPS